MNDHKRRASSSGPLPTWVTIVVILGLLTLLGYNVVIVGPEGYPTSMLLGGLLGTYAGVDQLLKKRREEAIEKEPTPPTEGGEPP